MLEPVLPYDNVRNFYTQTYPTDELGAQINQELTFSKLWKYMRMGVETYTLLGVGDSLVRERVFTELAKRLHVKYDVVYNVWLHDQVEFEEKDFITTP